MLNWKRMASIHLDGHGLGEYGRAVPDLQDTRNTFTDCSMRSSKWRSRRGGERIGVERAAADEKWHKNSHRWIGIWNVQKQNGYSK
jgi:hypothetical protein